jgi:quinol monooxygenase YgiN
MHVVIVKFLANEKHLVKFRELVTSNAAQSLANEEGCKVFDVCEMPGGNFWLYELYDDAEAFDVHLKTPHFLDFSSVTSPMVSDKQVWIGNRLPEASAEAVS